MTFNVLHVTPFFPPDQGGLSYHVYNIGLQLTKLGNDISIICPTHIRDNTESCFEGTVQRVRSIYLPGWPYPTLRSMSIPITLSVEIGSLIKNGSFDLVHVHGHHFPITWLAINSAYKNGIPIIMSLHGAFALNPFSLGGRSYIEEWLNKKFFPRIFNKAAAIVGLTNEITEYGKSISTRPKYFTIPNGVDTKRYSENLSFRQEFRKKYGLNPKAKVIFFNGRFEHVKGIVEFAYAVKMLVSKFKERVEIVIAGKGALRGRVEEILNSLKEVHLLGWQDPDKIHELYIAADIFVLPSRFEGLSLTIIEAMNAGLDIVYTDVGGISDALQGYQKKILLKNVSVEQISNILTELIDSKVENTVATEQDLQYARTFDWKNVALKLNEVYLSVKSGKI